MSIEKKASSEYAKNATSDANTVNYLFTFIRGIWASVFFITASILFIENVSTMASLLLFVHGLMSLRSVQRLFFKSYGGGKLTLQYVILFGGLAITLT